MAIYLHPEVVHGKIKNNVANYQPSKEVRELFAHIRKDYLEADRIRNKSYEEFNDRDLISYMNDSQRAFNSYVPPQSNDPDQAWMANTVRPLTRNKCISIAAHVTSAVLYPNVVAQNQDDEEDREAAEVMRDLMDFSWQDSDYEKAFVFGVISALFNPVVVLEDGYAEIKRQIKEINKSGGYALKEVIDEVYSGFYNHLVSPEELFIGNFYEQDIQKQPFLIRRRIMSYTDAKMRYGHLEAFKQYVMPGVRFFYNDENDLFYEHHDEELESTNVEEIVYYNRLQDLELRVVNGVLLDDPDRPMQRKDKRYPFAKSFFEPLDDGRCFYGKSLADKLRPDQGVIDVLYNMIIDGTYLQIMPPQALFGDEELDSAVVVPGKVTPMRETTQISSLAPNSNLAAGLKVLEKAEGSAHESSSDPLQSGMAARGAQTAFEIARLEQNAKTVLGLFGKMIKFLVEDFGTLRLNTALQHMTVADVLDTTTASGMLRFRNVLVPDKQTEDGKKTRKIEFTTDVPETEEQLEARSEELLLREFKKDMEIVQVNPTMFRRLKYKVKIEADMLFSQSETVRKALNLELYDRAIQNPAVDQEAVTRKFLLGSYVPGEEDKYIKEQPTAPLTGGGQTGLSSAIMKNSAQLQNVV